MTLLTAIFIIELHLIQDLSTRKNRRVRLAALLSVSLDEESFFSVRWVFFSPVDEEERDGRGVRGRWKPSGSKESPFFGWFLFCCFELKLGTEEEVWIRVYDFVVFVMRPHERRDEWGRKMRSQSIITGFAIG